MSNLLEVRDLSVSFFTYAGEVQAVRGVNFEVNHGEAVAIVGESGCGKSVTAKSIMKLLATPPARYKSGSVIFDDQDIFQLKERDMQKIRGNDISMIFQDPMTSLNPTSKIGNQIIEAVLRHKRVSKKEASKIALQMLELVGIPQPEKRMSQYPHEYSGGMRQRAMIAMALACEPRLLIADEPTTALDVTIQAQILELMKELQRKMDTSIILITHDLGVVAEMCDRVIVMYAGKVVETAEINELFGNPQHPYTKGLLKSIPRLDQRKNDPLLPIVGTPPDLLSPPKGCAFFPRCEFAMGICREYDPNLEEIEAGHTTACWLQHPMAQASSANERR